MAKEPIRSLSVRLKGMHWFPGLGGGAGERGSASLLSRSGGGGFAPSGDQGRAPGYGVRKRSHPEAERNSNYMSQFSRNFNIRPT